MTLSASVGVFPWSVGGEQSTRGNAGSRGDWEQELDSDCGWLSFGKGEGGGANHGDERELLGTL